MSIIIQAAERYQKIKLELENYGFVSINELAERIGISASTVRRDLIDMEKEDFLVRTRGGAKILSPEFTLAKVQSYRAVQCIKEKQKIGQKAAELIEDSGCIILDAGTTTLEVARHLKPKNMLRVITDSIEIAYELKDRENMTVLVTGGILSTGSYNMYGSFGEHAMSNMHAQVCVMGATGITLREGLTKHDIEALPIRKKMVEISHRIICVADSKKFGYMGLVSICPINMVDVLVTDDGIKPDFKKGLEDLGIEVVIAY